jgi:restriction system protein
MRGGEKGCYEADALSHGLAIVDWSELGDFACLKNKEDLKSSLQKHYPIIPATRITRWVPQVWYFRSDIKVSDLLAMPMKGKRYFLIGEVVGDYEFLGENNQPYKHVRRVSWFEREVYRADLDDDLRHSLGCLMTICKIKRENAAERIREML